jgi:hypothetical protein
MKILNSYYLLLSFIFLACVSCKRYLGATVSQDVFLTNCNSIKSVLSIKAMESNRCANTNEEIEEVLKGFQYEDSWGQPYIIRFLGCDKYEVRSIGRDGIIDTKDDRFSDIQLLDGTGRYSQQLDRK